MPQPGRTSLFAQRMLKKRENELKEANMELDSAPSGVFDRDSSYILEGAEADQIHRENVEKLSTMSREELEEERRKLMVEMDPGIVAFLQNKRKCHQKEVTLPFNNNSGSTSAMDTACGEGPDKETVPVTEIPDVKQLLNKYVNMDTVEEDKLHWIGEMKKPELPQKDKAYNARFDFEGTLLPYADEGEGVLKGLHNHGEEQSRPGYTLQELMQLSRSSVLQQRVIALNTLAKIMKNAHQYEDCFNEPLLPRLVEDSDLFLLFRLSMDDLAQPIVMAAVQALSALLVNNIDETCLDLLLGTPLGIQQPSLGVVLDMKRSDMDELKDDEIFKLDVIRGVLRTQLLHRIRYIIDEMNPEPVEVKCMLKCITRIARHSYEIAEEIFNCPGLIDSICSLFKRQSSSYFPEALKLIRILVSRSSTMAHAILDNHSILTSIFSFIAGETGYGHPELMHLTLESFYTWQSILSYNISTETIGTMTPVLMRLLEVHYGLTNLNLSSVSDLEHATAIMSIVNSVAKVDFNAVSHILPLATRLTVKWATQIFSNQELQLSAVKLIGASLHLMATSQANFDTGYELVAIVEKLLRSNYFSRIVQRLRKFSWLLCGEVKPHPDNLPHLGSIPPTLRPESSLPFIHGLASYVLATSNNVLKRLFISNVDVVGYIEELLKSLNLNKMCTHWYARQELTFLIGVINIYIRIKDVCGINDVYHNLAYLLLTAVQSGDKCLLPDVFTKLIFCPHFFRNCIDTISDDLKYLSVEEIPVANKERPERYKLVSNALENLDKIEVMYWREFGMDSLSPIWRPPVTLTGLLNSTQPAFPTDWPFAPLIRLYNTHGDTQGSVEVATRCLQFILLLEESSLSVMDSTSPSARFCRLSCLYLAGNDLFREVTPLLEAILHNLLRYSSKLDFEKPVPGLTSFYDFYRQLLEHYVGVSYCDVTFGQYVLVPLQQRQSSKYKKLLWSEMGAVIRLLNTPVSKVNMKDYLEPYETDPDILMSYLYFLATGRVCEVWSPVLYKVALHHVATYIDKSSDDRVKKALSDRINKLGNRDLQQLLLNYNTDV